MTSLFKNAFLALFLTCWSISALAEGLDLTKLPVKLMIGDDPAFAEPGFSDRSWSQHDILAVGEAVASKADLTDSIYWQRITFDGAKLKGIAQPALHIGVLYWGNVFYLNGVEFAREAMHDKPFGGIYAGNDKGMPRVLPIPEDLLNLDGNNVLAIRSARGGLEAVILAGPVEITEESYALGKAQGKILFFVLYNSLSLFIFILAFLLTLIVWLSTREKKNGLGWLLLAFMTLLPHYLFNTSLALYLDLSVSPVLFPYLTASISALCLIPLLEFSARHLKIRIRWYIRLIQLATLLLPVIPDPEADFLFPISRLDTLIWMALLLATFLLITIWAIYRALQRDRRAYPIVIGATAVWIGSALVLLGGEMWFFANTGTGSGDITVPIFLISLAWAGMQPLFEARARLAEAQNKVLQAQEYERRRIAYDIHDGVGQWLSTIKLNLQMLQGLHRDKTIAADVADVVSHVDSAISDTRRIAHDLSPAMIEQKGLVAAMKSHADVIHSRSGTNVTVSANSDTDDHLPATAQGHLYRIFQEALQNAIRHGQASKIGVAFETDGKGYIFSIDDNGIGFDQTHHSKGLGLDSMHRRADLLNADMTVISEPGQGSRLEIRGVLPRGS